MDKMSDEEKQPKMIYGVVMAVILAMSVLLTAWTASKAVSLGELVSTLQASVSENSTRLDYLEKYGSRTLEAHVSSDDARVIDIKARLDKLESAVLVLLSTPGELKAMGVQLEALKEGQERIEKSLSSKPTLNSTALSD